MQADAHSLPTICLAMIVRNEAHIIHELIASVASHIDHWVIVDTGSTDGTQDLIRRLMADRGIPGDLFERPWRDFGANRSEALALAKGRCDYVWMMDADDILVGTIDFSDLQADGYSLRIRDALTYWRIQLFRDGLPWRYAGVLHEMPVCDAPHTVHRLEGVYHIHSRRLGERNRDPRKYAHDAEVLRAEVDRNPEDTRAVFYLAQSYFDAGEFGLARHWYERRAQMGGWHEEVFWARYRSAIAMERIGEPWPSVQDAYLRAWATRPTRAEPLYAIARHYRTHRDYQLGYLFAEHAARIPLPVDDSLFVPADIYLWRALDEQAVCASWLGKHAEAQAICTQLLRCTDLSDEDRRRIAANRDLAATHMTSTDGPRPQARTVPPSTGEPAIRQALTRRLMRRAIWRGEIRLPAVPAMLDEYQTLCESTFAARGVTFSADQQQHLRDALASQLSQAWVASPRSEIVIHYDSPVGLTVNYQVKAQWSSLAGVYDQWVSTRQPPFFGTHPDARVMALAHSCANSKACPVLDIGAGTGRNALALARRGHPVDAVELSGQFAAILRDEAAEQGLDLRVLERDVFTTTDDLRDDYGLIVLSEVASDFRSTQQLRQVFELATACLAPQGQLVLNLFLARDGYEPDEAARELGQQVYTALFTRQQLKSASENLPLETVSDEGVVNYEKEHLPKGAWPPTAWYAEWAQALDLFDLEATRSPVELRWLVYLKR